jgi:murein DD-endopeptidase MepM/ murein hydrolase activator NlpD
MATAILFSACTKEDFMSIFNRIAEAFTSFFDEDEPARRSGDDAASSVRPKARVREGHDGGASVELPGRLVVSRDRYGNWNGHGSYAPRAGESLAQSAKALGLDEEVLSFVNPRRKAGQSLRVPLGSGELRAAREAYEEHEAWLDAGKIPHGPELAWTNPTGQGIRNDNAGYGTYEAPRGKRKHAGIDYVGKVGDPVFATIGGAAELIDDGVRITTRRGADNTQYSVRMLHFTPSIRHGSQVKEGQIIGTLNDLADQYKKPAMKPHAHLEVYEIENGKTKRRNPGDFIKTE